MAQCPQLPAIHLVILRDLIYDLATQLIHLLFASVEYLWSSPCSTAERQARWKGKPRGITSTA